MEAYKAVHNVLTNWPLVYEIRELTIVVKQVGIDRCIKQFSLYYCRMSVHSLTLVYQCADRWLVSVVEMRYRCLQAGYYYWQRCESQLNQLFLQNLSLEKKEKGRGILTFTTAFNFLIRSAVSGLHFYNDRPWDSIRFIQIFDNVYTNTHLRRKAIRENEFSLLYAKIWPLTQ